MTRRINAHRILKLPVVIALVATVGAGAGLGLASAVRPAATPVTKPGVLVDDIGPVSAFAGTPSTMERAVAARPELRKDMEAITAETEAVPDEFLPGDRVGPVRVPLAQLGAGNRAIWMYRTTRGKVCYGLTNFTAGCVHQLPVGQVLNPTGGDPGDGSGTIVWGFARDNVRSVNIVVGGETQPAVMGRNAFFFQASSAAARITAVVATTANGSSVTIPVTFKQGTKIE